MYSTYKVMDPVAALFLSLPPLFQGSHASAIGRAIRQRCLDQSSSYLLQARLEFPSIESNHCVVGEMRSPFPGTTFLHCRRSWWLRPSRQLQVHHDRSMKVFPSAVWPAGCEDRRVNDAGFSSLWREVLPSGLRAGWRRIGFLLGGVRP